MDLIEGFETRLARSRNLHISTVHLGLVDPWSLKLIIELLRKEVGAWPTTATID